MKISMIIFLFLLINIISEICSNEYCSCNVQNFRYNGKFNLSSNYSLHIFELKEPTSNLLWSWHETIFHIDTIGFDSIEIYDANNSSEVFEKCKISSQSFNFISYIYEKIRKLFTTSNSKTFIYFNPFKIQSIGIKIWDDSSHLLQISTKFIWVKFIITLVGIILYISSKRLSKSIVFHYSIGVSFGLVGSLILFAFIISKFVPFRKTIGGLFFICGSFFATRIFKFKDEILELIQDNIYLAASYIIFISGVTISLIYYYYPNEMSKQTLNIINVMLKFVSLILICFSTSNIYTIGMILTFIILNDIRSNIYFIDWFSKIYYRFRPKRRKLIKPEIYPKILAENTENELNKLRNYLKSADLDVWKLVAQSPHLVNKLSNFVNKGEHISPTERDEYYTDAIDESDFDNDDDEDDDVVNISTSKSY